MFLQGSSNYLGSGCQQIFVEVFTFSLCQKGTWNPAARRVLAVKTIRDWQG
jgi:hypothetical protein